jgi:DNA modification methylase
MREEIIGDCRLILGDCRDILPMLGPVDAVVTDPPYGIGWKPRVNHQDQRWVDEIEFDMRQILVGRRHIVWGGQYFADVLPVHEGWLTWCKRPSGSGLDFSNDKRTYATTELAWRDFGKSAFIVHVWDGGMRAGNADNRTFCHPSQKPIEVMEWCIGHLPPEDQIVFDPFMGSGTTGVACVNLGRSFVGVERDPEYFDTACKRLDAAQKQPRLFAEPQVKPIQEVLI